MKLTEEVEVWDVKYKFIAAIFKENEVIVNKRQADGTKQCYLFKDDKEMVPINLSKKFKVQGLAKHVIYGLVE